MSDFIGLSSRKDILTKVHNEILEKLVRNELDVAFFEALLLSLSAGNEAVNAQKELLNRRETVKQLKLMHRKIEEMIAIEDKNKKIAN